MPTRFDCFADDAIESFDWVGCVNGSAHLGRISEKRCHRSPCAAPGLDHTGVALAPVCFELIERRLGILHVERSIDFSHAFADSLTVFPRHIPTTGADDVNDACLKHGLGKRCFYGLWEPFEAIGA